MLTAAQAGHFTTFGFVVLRGFLADRVAALRAEVDAAIRDAYAATYDERVIDGISGHYLPMASRLTPVSGSLVCDDPRFIDAAQQLLGGPVIPECPEGVLYFFEAGWHTDDGTGVRGVKFAAYFDELAAANGALRLVPGSHHPQTHARLATRERRQPPVRTGAGVGTGACRASLPGYVADTVPGDVIAFDLHTWHASFGGRDRLAWTAVYQRCPETAAERDRTLRSVHDSFEQAFRGFDRGRYPVWRDWLDGAAAHACRGPVIERMRQAGVLGLPGARDGW
ncbi:MAG: phytanoyl-CoA dioxygenase family protein [Streptosporangiaceae bacterium]|nr:phytanoyl-CoA dioxygenase family protein [Streptosporangiaceae bacterium]MBV9857195.1 phytanoyl-CoA dioxygenase family protein [Streptosporangiaceae bacterium]